MTSVNSARTPGHVVDAETRLHSAGEITTTTAGTVGGSVRVLDTKGAYFGGDLVLLINSADETTGNEIYTITFEGADNEAMDSNLVTLASIPVTAALVGKIVRHVSNWYHENTFKRYVRVRATLAGTTPILDYEAFLSKGTLPSG